jgi:hypothetical protein
VFFFCFVFFGGLILHPTNTVISYYGVFPVFLIEKDLWCFSGLTGTGVYLDPPMFCKVSGSLSYMEVQDGIQTHGVDGHVILSQHYEQP